MKKYGFLLLCCFVLAYAAPRTPINSIVAVVNDNIITAFELNKQTGLLRKQLLAEHAAVPPSQVLRKQVLNALIDQQLQLQLAKNLDVHVEPSEIDAAIEKISRSNQLSRESFKEQLRNQGIAWQDFTDQIQKQLIVQKVQEKEIAQNIVVDPKEVEKVKTSLAQEDNLQREYRIQDLIVRLSDDPTSEELVAAKKKAQNALASLKAGKKFESVAMAYSEDGNALNGGDWGWKKIMELPESFAEKVKNLKDGQIVGPIRTGNGLHVIKLVATRTPHALHMATETHVRHILLKTDALQTDEIVQAQLKTLRRSLKNRRRFYSTRAEDF